MPAPPGEGSRPAKRRCGSMPDWGSRKKARMPAAARRPKRASLEKYHASASVKLRCCTRASFSASGATVRLCMCAGLSSARRDWAPVRCPAKQRLVHR